MYKKLCCVHSTHSLPVLEMIQYAVSVSENDTDVVDLVCVIEVLSAWGPLHRRCYQKDRQIKQNRYHHLYCTTTIKYKSVMYATYVKPTRSGRTREQDYFRKTHAKPFFGAEQLRYLYSAQNYVRCQYGSSCSLSIFYSNVPKTQQRQRTH